MSVKFGSFFKKLSCFYSGKKNSKYNFFINLNSQYRKSLHSVSKNEFVTKISNKTFRHNNKLKFVTFTGKHR